MRLHRYAISLMLGAALIAPVSLQAKKHGCADQDGRHGYYDDDRKSCRYWSDGEDHHYITWEKARRKSHRDFARLKAKEQRAYWHWRSEHPDDADNDHR